MAATAISSVSDGDCRIAPSALPRGRNKSAFEWRDAVINLGANFRLESGEALNDPRLHVRLHGPEGAPLIIAAGGISAGRMVADADDIDGWWRSLARFGGAIDTRRRQVLGFDFLPGGESDVKTITPADQARALAIALEGLGRNDALGFVGASYGGFIGLAFAALYPARLARLCVISAAARSDPMTTALRGVQRRIIALGREAGREKDGVALARELAMTTYRTAEEFRKRFTCAPGGARAGDPYDVCEYLSSRGRAYAETMPAARYLTLSDSLDRARVDPSLVTARCMFIAAASDRLVPAQDTEETARAVSGPSTYLPIHSLVGHDAFLCDAPLYESALKRFLEEE